ncbi:MAG: biopolymer transporter ExbD [Proteobacteria bacterium]|nr:biopolymer transporter ExbD [Pseudomonadota bacterium]
MDSGDDAITEINVTPFVDVMLVLLVIFMVTANYIVNQSINIQLPKADTGQVIQSRNLAFVIDKESRVYLDGQAVEVADLGAKIMAFKGQQAEGTTIQALISADTATPHGAVVKVIDVIRKSGITELAINVEAASN